MRRLKSALALSVFIVALGALFAACEAAPAATGPQYTCSTGTPETGGPDGTSDVELCTACESTYRLVGGNCNTRTIYTCTGGVAQTGMPAGNDNVESCASCTSGEMPTSEGFCATMFPYVCTNGDPASGMDSAPNTQNCSACDIGYKREASGSNMVCNRVAVGEASRISAATSQFGASEDFPYDLAAIGNILYMVGQQNGVLYTLDTSDGSATRVGSSSSFGVGEGFPTGLAALGTVLYMVGAETNVLYTIDTTAGSATRVGSVAAGFGVGETNPGGLAAIGTTLYMVGRSNDRLYTLNITPGDGTDDGTAIRVGNSSNFGVGETSPTGLAALGNTLYMVGLGNDVLYTIDTTAGSATRVGSVAAGFGVSEDTPTGLAAIGSTLYMVGRSTNALHVLRYQ